MAKSVLKQKTRQFELVGHYKVNDRHPAFTLDCKSNSGKSYIYSRMNMMIDCGEKYGNQYLNLIGGFKPEGDTVIYCRGKDAEGRTDWGKAVQVAWDDRFNPSILETVANTSFLRVAIEKDKDDKNVVKRFLSEYDLIAYLAENLPDECALFVRGNIRYQVYNGNISRQLEPTFISLTDAETAKYHASFSQTILFDEGSIGDIDEDTNCVSIRAFVPEYTDRSVKALPYNFEYQLPKSVVDENGKINQKKADKIIDTLFGCDEVSEGTFDGEFINGGELVQATYDDLSDDVKMLIDLGVYSEEEALAKCTKRSGVRRRSVLLSPHIITRTLDDGSTNTEVQIYKDIYKDDVLHTSDDGDKDVRTLSNSKSKQSMKTYNPSPEKKEEKDDDLDDIMAMIDGDDIQF